MYTTINVESKFQRMTRLFHKKLLFTYFIIIYTLFVEFLYIILLITIHDDD